jgi:glutamate racemase
VDVRPIGIFDSGAGGLTVLHECLVTMPHEDFLYLGDGARCPYGPRPRAEIQRFAHEIASFLEEQGVKLIVAACNSATAAALPRLQERLAVPIVGVLAPEAPPLGGIVDQPRRREDRSLACVRDSDRLTLPEYGAALVDDPGRVDHRSALELVAERPC